MNDRYAGMALAWSMLAAALILIAVTKLVS
jgi:hypothetical protein